MIKIGASSKIEEVSKKEKNESKEKKKIIQKSPSASLTTIRPEVVDAKVYKLKSAFVKNSVFITLSYVKENMNISPIEIFIDSLGVSYFQTVLRPHVFIRGAARYL